MAMEESTTESENVPPELMDQVLENIYAGRKLRAIKLYQSARGVSLLEAKNFIEALLQELEEKQPDALGKSRGNSGCVSTSACFVCLVGLVGYWVLASS